ncbi:MAG: VOC family protein [Leptotrichiaceae bacterium]|nr:VOC family protein [Leptotrichiaceae bacterium]
MKIKSVAANIPVSNLEKSAKWYREVFLPEEEINISDGMPMIEYKIGQIWIQLFEGNIKKCDNSLSFEVENIQEECNRLKKMSVINDEKIEDIPGLVKYLEFKDPDGNNLCLVELYSE